jgi:hypothetical protein
MMHQQKSARTEGAEAFLCARMIQKQWQQLLKPNIDTSWAPQAQNDPNMGPP